MQDDLVLHGGGGGATVRESRTVSTVYCNKLFVTFPELRWFSEATEYLQEPKFPKNSEIFLQKTDDFIKNVGDSLKTSSHLIKNVFVSS